MDDYLYYMPALKRLEREVPTDPGLRYLAVLLNSALEKRLSAGTHTNSDIATLEAHMTDQDRARRPAETPS